MFYQVMPYPQLSCIGSTLHLIDDGDTIIWGSGLLKEDLLKLDKITQETRLLGRENNLKILL